MHHAKKEALIISDFDSCFSRTIVHAFASVDAGIMVKVVRPVPAFTLAPAGSINTLLRQREVLFFNAINSNLPR